jgi:quercetin dioxygenase-like cupin family protein
MKDQSKELTIVGQEEGQYISMVGDTYRVVISGKQTGGAYAVIDMMVPTNGGPGPHAHAEIQESFYVLDGEIEVKAETGTYIAKKGTFINIPLGGMVHCFKNKSQNIAHLWCVVVPSGLEEMFLEIGKPVEAGTFLPPPEMTPELAEKFKAIAEKYGQKLYPPDYLDK